MEQPCTDFRRQGGGGGFGGGFGGAPAGGAPWAGPMPMGGAGMGGAFPIGPGAPPMGAGYVPYGGGAWSDDGAAAEGAQGPFISRCGAPCGAVRCGGGGAGATSMNFVGVGRGEFVRETTYKFVGQGAGQFALTQPRMGTSYKSIFLGGMFAVFGLASVCILTLGRSGTATTTNVQRAAAMSLSPSAQEPFDCSPVPEGQTVTWKMSKRWWCCEHYEIYCDPDIGTIEPSYDCDAGLAGASLGWSEEKKLYCCNSEGRGCTRSADQQSASQLAPGVKECLVWGDPHINTFDGGHADVFGQGDVWLVKSAKVLVQARYQATPFTNGLAATDAIVVGGPFLNGNVLKVGPMDTGAITWNGERILTELPSTFNAPGGGTIAYNSVGNLVDSAQSQLERHIVHMDLPDGMHIQVIRWSRHVNVRITMSPIAGGQDGHCGNFDGDAANDSLAAVEQRLGKSVSRNQLLFRTYTIPESGKHVTLDDCPATKRTSAKQECLRAQPGASGRTLTACIFDVCFAGSRYALQDTVY